MKEKIEGWRVGIGNLCNTFLRSFFGAVAQVGEFLRSPEFKPQNHKKKKKKKKEHVSKTYR
jgi:hypothetical protein